MLIITRWLRMLFWSKYSGLEVMCHLFLFPFSVCLSWFCFLFFLNHFADLNTQDDIWGSWNYWSWKKLNHVLISVINKTNMWVIFFFFFKKGELKCTFSREDPTQAPFHLYSLLNNRLRNTDFNPPSLDSRFKSNTINHIRFTLHHKTEKKSHHLALRPSSCMSDSSV